MQPPHGAMRVVVKDFLWFKLITQLAPIDLYGRSPRSLNPTVRPRISAGQRAVPAGWRVTTCSR
jgi:hypothetical protein